MATALPAATDFTGASITEAQFKTALTNMRTFLADLLGADGVEATALAAIMAPFSAVNAQTAAYSLVAGDRGKVIYYTGSGGVALTLPVTSTTDFGVGYSCSVVNLSTGTITLTRSSTDTIDGATTLALDAGSSTILFIAAAGKWVSIGKASVNGAFRSKQIFTSSGTWTKPSGLKRVKVTVIGGGGGGANDIGSTDNFNGAGAGGGTAIEWIEAASLGATETVTIGAAGAGATGATAAAGTAGGTTSFGAHCSATGGAGGAILTSAPVTPAAGGAGSGGNINLTGERGGTTVVMYDGTSYYWRGGDGGNSSMGVGGAGGKTDAAGAAGTGYGAGGGSGYALSTTDRNGGNGTAGFVLVEEYF